MNDICTVNNCSNRIKVKSLGICQAHYFRLRRNGAYGNNEIRTPGTIKLCSVDGCNRKYKSNGFCDKHAQRAAKWGDPLVVKTVVRYGKDNPSWKYNKISYSTAHRRVTLNRGKASFHKCVSCGTTAKHWAYDHLDKNELVENELSYSINLEHYLPMCVSCHKIYDLVHSLHSTITREAVQ